MTKNNFFKRAISSLLAASCLTFSMSGCAKQVQTPNSKVESTTKVGITVASSFGSTDDSAPDYTGLLNGFKKSAPNVTVIDQSAKADDHWKAAIREQFNVGKEPDVMFFYSATDVRSIIEKEQVVSVEEIRRVYPDFAMNISPKALEDIKEFNGKTYAVPVMRFWEGMFYNEALFKENNIAPVTDWASFEKAIKAFKAKGITPIAASFADIPNYWIEHVILSTGGVAEHSKNPKKEEDVPKSWIDGLDTLKQLYDMGAFSSECLITQHELAINSFNKGEAAMLLEGSWINLAPEIMPKIRVSPMPSKANVKPEEKGVISGLSM
ncbi:MAG: ABC transporter substrate-binding protein, partial [Oscillospiraceae bacterium]